MASEAEQTSTAVLPRSEDVVKNEWDRCVANGLVKTGAGICVGVVLSALLFKSTPSALRAKSLLLALNTLLT